jgi:hypothetical protein
MIIPKAIELAGLRVTTEIQDDLHAKRGILGEAQYTNLKILLDGTVLHPILHEQNYIHELVHFILYVMSEDELRNNEKFVETFAFLLHQAIRSGGFYHDS